MHAARRTRVPARVIPLAGRSGLTLLEVVENELGQLLVSAVEVMSALERQDHHIGRAQLRTKRILVVLTPDAEDLLLGDLIELGTDGKAFGSIAQPVAHVKLELHLWTGAEQRDQSHPPECFRWQSIRHRRKHIRSPRVSDQDHTASLPGGSVVLDDALQVA